MKRFIHITIIMLAVFGTCMTNTASAQCQPVPSTPSNTAILSGTSYSQRNLGGSISAEFNDGTPTPGWYGGAHLTMPIGRFSWLVSGAGGPPPRDLKTNWAGNLVLDITAGNTNEFPGSLGITQDTFMVFNYGGSYYEVQGNTMKSSTINFVNPAPATVTNPLVFPGIPDDYTLLSTGSLTNATSAGLYYVMNIGNVTFNTDKAIYLKNMDMQIAAKSTWTKGIIYPAGTNNGSPAKVKFGGQESTGVLSVPQLPVGISAAGYVNGLTQLVSGGAEFILPTGDGCGAYYAPLTVTTAAGTIVNAQYSFKKPDPAFANLPESLTGRVPGTMVDYPLLNLSGITGYNVDAADTVGRNTIVVTGPTVLPDIIKKDLCQRDSITTLTETDVMVINRLSPAYYQIDGSSAPNMSDNETMAAPDMANRTNATNATIKVPYDSIITGHVFSASGINTPVLVGYNGTRWVLINTTGGSAGSIEGVLTATNINLTAYSKLAIALVTTVSIYTAVVNYPPECMEIPITMVPGSFKSNSSHCNANLQWQTSKEIESKSFEVETSTDNINFTHYATVLAAANSNAIRNYSITIPDVKDAFRLYVRLKLINTHDLSYTYTDTLAVDINCVILNSFSNIPSTHCNAALSWTTSHESQAKSFDVETSTDNMNFSTYANVPAMAGNSNAVRNYSYVIPTVNVNTLYVRIKPITNTVPVPEIYKYSNTLTIAINCGDIVTVYPNPVKANSQPLTLKLESSMLKGTARIMVVDALGRQLSSQDVTINRAVNYYTVPVNHLAAGVYFVKFIPLNGSGETKTMKVLVVR